MPLAGGAFWGMLGVGPVNKDGPSAVRGIEADMKTLTIVTMLVGAGLAAGGVAAAQEQPPYDDEPNYQQYEEQTNPSMQPVDPYQGNGQTEVYDDDDNASAYDEGYDPNAYSQFESTLSPYGEWYDDATYGRVWAPSVTVVGYGFSPYGTGGHWVFTEYGWTWVSDWDWGWAPFHYGRWVSLRRHGWCWIPGTVWGPGWVSWRGGHGYVGWAPLPPARVRVHDYRRPGWRFTGAGELGSPRMRYLDMRNQATTVFARTRVIRNDRAMPLGGTSVRYNTGPSVRVPATRLADVAPRAVPRFNVTPHVGQAPGPGTVRTWDRRSQPQQAPQYRAPQQQPQYRAPQPQPQYRAPQPQQQQPQPQPQPQYQTPRIHDQRPQPRSFYRPSFAPRPQFATPRFQQVRAQAPAYRAQVRTQAPVYRAQSFSRPSYSAPRSGARVHDGRR